MKGEKEMAHFIADIEGNRGPTSRLGTAKSGIRGHVRGWNLGASVWCDVNDEGEDFCVVTLTAGSNRRGPDILLFSGTRADFEKLAAERKTA